MFDLIYIEEAIRDHPRTLEVLERLPRATRVSCAHYGEVFNRKAQNFRLQKQRPALILAQKHGKFVLETPPGYGIGAERNFYFSHMLNCVYDCRYCFLQGMYRSAHLVLFVNYDDFIADIERTAGATESSVCFFSGYDCDSLALEPLSGFIKAIMPVFERFSHAELELRTKSTQVRELLARPAIKNCVVAFSLNPENVVDAVEAGTATLERRLEAMQELAARGWPLGLRFDPMIYHEDFRRTYGDFFEHVFEMIPTQNIHSVSLGTFRLPRDMFKSVRKLYPEEKIFAFGMDESGSMVSYRDELSGELLRFCREEILRRVPEARLFECEA
jgi:spore photoproduct lyase